MCSYAVVVRSVAEYLRMVCHPGSMFGEWNATAGLGHVYFPTQDSRNRAERELAQLGGTS